MLFSVNECRRSPTERLIAQCGQVRGDPIGHSRVCHTPPRRITNGEIAQRTVVCSSWSLPDSQLSTSSRRGLVVDQTL